MSSSKRVVYVAMAANFLIAIAKFFAAGVTGSSAMLSEAYHSVSDTGNQVLLLLGIKMSERRPSKRHPFGYGKEQFFFSFIVSVVLFGVAGYASLSEGFHRLGSTKQIEHPSVSLLVLGVAFLFEGTALSTAINGFRREMKEYGGIVETFQESRDAPLLTAFTEDLVALLGIVAAIVGISLSVYLENTLYDAASSIFIGVMLMAFAMALAWENRKLLIGEAVSPETRTAIKSHLSDWNEVDRIMDLKSMTIGPNSVLVVAGVRFVDGLTTDELEDLIDEIEADLQEEFPEIASIYVEVT